MAFVRWEPEVTRLFTTLFDTPTTGQSAPARRWAPAMDLAESADHYVLRADLPGLAPDDVTIELHDRVLTVAGERRPEEPDGGRFVRIERASGAFSRTVTLPEGVDVDAVAASFVNGVLEVRIPKPEQRKPRRVAIDTGDRAKVIEG